ncbi:MAG: hypothetical protein ACR2IH_03605 [Pyrinomonadaceae bacterium]
MKRCPECRRDYTDDTLLYCLDDGNALLDGPATLGQDEPATAILSGIGLSGDSPTRRQINTTNETAVLPANINPSQSKRNLSVGKPAALIAMVAVLVP